MLVMWATMLLAVLGSSCPLCFASVVEIDFIGIDKVIYYVGVFQSFTSLAIIFYLTLR